MVKSDENRWVVFEKMELKLPVGTKSNPNSMQDHNDTSAADSCTKVLGMFWNTFHDSFHYREQTPEM